MLLVVLLMVSIPALVRAQDPAPSQPAGGEGPTLRLGGYIQYDYLARSGEGVLVPDTFRFRRVRLQGSGTLNPHIGWSVTVEATTTPFLRDAFVVFSYVPALTVRAGQLVMPYGLEQYVFSSNTMPFTERVTTEIIASRDAGVMVSNEHPFFGWLYYAAAVTNGTRQNVTDNNSAKDGVGRVTVAPPALPGFRISLNATKGQQPGGLRTRRGGDVSFERRLFHVAAEYDEERTGSAPRKRGGFVFGAWRVYPRSRQRGFHHLEFGTRVARTAHFAVPQNHWEISTNYYVNPNLRLMFDVIRHTRRAADSPQATFHARVNIRFQ